MTTQLITDMAAQLYDLSERERTLQNTRSEVLTVNSIRAIDWRNQAWIDLGLASADDLVYLSEFWPTSLYGAYSCNDIANFVGSVQAIDDAFGTSGGTIEKLTTASIKTLLLRVADQPNIQATNPATRNGSVNPAAQTRGNSPATR